MNNATVFSNLMFSSRRAHSESADKTIVESILPCGVRVNASGLVLKSAWCLRILPPQL